MWKGKDVRMRILAGTYLVILGIIGLGTLPEYWVSFLTASLVVGLPIFGLPLAVWPTEFSRYGAILLPRGHPKAALATRVLGLMMIAAPFVFIAVVEAA